jgi:hypothetical protein
MEFNCIVHSGNIQGAGGEITEIIEINGNCRMFENRIKKTALSLSGVSEAEWDQESTNLEVTYDDQKTSNHHQEYINFNIKKNLNFMYQFVHNCYGDEIDTTFMLNYCQYNDSGLICLTEDDFEDREGHMLGESHMGDSTMSDIGINEMERMHHMSDEQDGGDEHFGGFDMHN